MSYVLGGKRFETTTAVSDYARIILHRALPGFALEGEDAAFVADLFSLHPDAGRKAGVGIEFFYVGGSPRGELGTSSCTEAIAPLTTSRSRNASPH